MKISSLRLPAIMAIALALAACSAANHSAENETRIGCKIDTNRICQRALTQPVASSSGITTSNQSYITQNSPATTWVMVPIKAPGGSEVDVNCELSYSQKRVIYGTATASGTVSDPDREWLHKTGMCIGSTATTPAPKLGVKE